MTAENYFQFFNPRAFMLIWSLVPLTGIFLYAEYTRKKAMNGAMLHSLQCTSDSCPDVSPFADSNAEPERSGGAG